MMRIAFPCSGTVPIPPLTYGNRAIYDLLLSLRKLGHTVELFNDRPAGLSVPSYLARLPHVVRRFDPDAVQVNQSEVAVALGILGIRFFNTPWAFEWYQNPHPGTWWGFKGNIRDRWALRLSDVIITPTPESHGRLTSYGFSPVVYIPQGVDTDKFKPSNGGGDPTLALGLGIVDRRKRWELAAKGLVGTGVRFRVVGPVRDPAYGAELKALGTEIIGEVPEERLLDELDGCGFVIHPSDREGFAAAILQAMAFKKPVIVSAHSAHVIGTIPAPTDEPADVTRTIRNNALVYARDASYLRRDGTIAREAVEKHYSNDAIARQYVEVYRRFAQGAS
jgi:glycosyltransferase involved in cell wall biosynthesis